MYKIFLIITILCSSSLTSAESLPKDVQRLIDEYAAADHFSGEINGDKSERDKEVIRKGNQALNYASILSKRLKIKYKSNPDVMNRLNQYPISNFNPPNDVSNFLERFSNCQTLSSKILYDDENEDMKTILISGIKNYCLSINKSVKKLKLKYKDNKDINLLLDNYYLTPDDSLSELLAIK